VNDVHVAGGVLVDTAGVVLERVWDSDTASNWTSLVNFLHHGLLSRDLAVLLGSIDQVFVWDEARLVWHAVLADSHGRASLSVIVTSGSVDGASLISDLVLGHPLESVVCLSSVATIITTARDENLRSDVDVWPLSLSSNLDSI
jgi:hypothetical protein